MAEPRHKHCRSLGGDSHTSSMQVKLTAWEDCCSKQLPNQTKLEVIPPHSKEFFTQIDSEFSPGATDYYSDWESFSESESYCLELLKLFEKELLSTASANLVSEDGETISLPLLVLSLAWPDLGKTVNEALCCSSDITIFVPCDGTTLVHLKEIIFHGSSSGLTTGAEALLLEFMACVGLKWSIARHYTEDVVDPQTLIIGESFDDLEEEEDEDDDGEDEQITVERVEHLWQPRVGTTLVSRKKQCSPSCSNDCHKVVKAWSEKAMKIVKDSFSSKNILSVKNQMISHLEYQGIVGSPTDSYILQGHAFCLNYLSHLTGHSVYLLKGVLKDYWRGVKRYEHGNKGILKIPTTATMGFICWFKSFLALYGQSAPDSQIIVLSYWLKGKVLFKLYQEEAPAPHVKLTTFYSHLKTYFGPKRIDQTLPCHRISKYSSHSVCDICVNINQNRKLCKTEAELSMTKALMNQHKIDFGMARKTVESLRQLSIDFPNDVLFLQLDGMDNSKAGSNLNTFEAGISFEDYTEGSFSY